MGWKAGSKPNSSQVDHKSVGRNNDKASSEEHKLPVNRLQNKYIPPNKISSLCAVGVQRFNESVVDISDELHMFCSEWFQKLLLYLFG